MRPMIFALLVAGCTGPDGLNPDVVDPTVDSPVIHTGDSDTSVPDTGDTGDTTAVELVPFAIWDYPIDPGHGWVLWTAQPTTCSELDLLGGHLVPRFGAAPLEGQSITVAEIDNGTATVVRLDATCNGDAWSADDPCLLATEVQGDGEIAVLGVGGIHVVVDAGAFSVDDIAADCTDELTGA